MKKIVVLGSGESGVGAAILAKQKGFDVFVSDKGQIKENYKIELEKHAVPYEEGAHDEARILSADEIIKSPGIPDKAPLVMAAVQKGIPVISEIEFASRFSDAFTIGITGSNGKTTTTNLVYHILKTAGKDVAMGGNVGYSFARLVAEAPRSIYVLELSSFQLDGIVDYRPDIAILLNITPDHLDRYDYKMENYVASKFRIAMNQKPADKFIYNAADEQILGFLNKNKIAPEKTGIEKVLFENEKLTVGKAVFDFSKSKLKGIHNYFNATCAIHAAWAVGVENVAIQTAIDTFQPVPHRMEPLTVIEGVEFINDSKATNVDSVLMALQSMNKPLVWIAGGQDKGNDYAPLTELVKNKVRSIVCLGVDNQKIIDSFSKLCPIVETRSATGAVEAAFEMAKTGFVVVLSPACASFDLFKNYEDRGDQFKAAVEAFAKKRKN